MKAGASKLILDSLLKYANDFGIIPLQTSGVAPRGDDSLQLDEGTVELSLSGIKLRTPGLLVKPFTLTPTVIIRSLDSIGGVEIEADLNSLKLNCTHKLMGWASVDPCFLIPDNKIRSQFNLTQHSPALQETSGWFSNYTITIKEVELDLDLGSQLRAAKLRLEDLLCKSTSKSSSLSISAASVVCNTFSLRFSGIGASLKNNVLSRFTIAKLEVTITSADDLANLVQGILSSKNSGTSGSTSNMVPFGRVDMMEVKMDTVNLKANITMTEVAIYEDSFSFGSMITELPALLTSFRIDGSKIQFNYATLPDLQVSLFQTHTYLCPTHLTSLQASCTELVTLLRTLLSPSANPSQPSDPSATTTTTTITHLTLSICVLPPGHSR